MMESVIECVYAHAQNTPEKTAVIVRGETTNYHTLYSLVAGYASFLRKKGLKRGDVVVAQSSQTLSYVIVYLGIHLAGGVVTSVGKNVSGNGAIADVASAVNAEMIISEDVSVLQYYNAIFIDSTEVMKNAKEIKPIDFAFPSGDDSADILFTTGTTGASKGVELSHQTLVATAENLIYGCEYSKDTVILVPGPLNHANPIRKLFTSFVNGSAIYILNGMVDVKAFFTALNYPEGKIACCLPPSAIRTIFQLTGDEIGKYADKIDFIESATAPLPEPDKEQLCALLPNSRLYNNYGSSESASVCIYNYNQYRGKNNCVGKVMPNAKVFIVDQDRKSISSSKENPGLLACAGDVNMKAYVNELELTQEVLVDGVVYTNDIGYIDQDGFVYVTGRQGDVINVGGLKVAPTEVEEAALAIEGIEDCICIPMDHPITGQALKLLVVMNRDADFSPRQFSDQLKIRLDSYKVPSKYVQVDHIARTYNGKLDRKAYREF